MFIGVKNIFSNSTFYSKSTKKKITRYQVQTQHYFVCTNPISKENEKYIK